MISARGTGLQTRVVRVAKLAKSFVRRRAGPRVRAVRRRACLQAAPPDTALALIVGGRRSVGAVWLPVVHRAPHTIRRGVLKQRPTSDHSVLRNSQAAPYFGDAGTGVVSAARITSLSFLPVIFRYAFSTVFIEVFSRGVFAIS